MAAQFDHFKENIDKSLRDKSKPWTQAFEFLESKSNIPRLYLFLGKKLCDSSLFAIKFILYLWNMLE